MKETFAGFANQCWVPNDSHGFQALLQKLFPSPVPRCQGCQELSAFCSHREIAKGGGWDHPSVPGPAPDAISCNNYFGRNVTGFLSFPKLSLTTSSKTNSVLTGRTRKTSRLLCPRQFPLVSVSWKLSPYKHTYKVSWMCHCLFISVISSPPITGDL